MDQPTMRKTTRASVAAAIFAAFHLPFFAPSLLMALGHRGAGNRVAVWWPSVLLCAVPLATIAVAALPVAGQANP